MTISAEQREELEDELAQATEAGKGLMVVGTNTVRVLLHDSARLKQIERQIGELADELEAQRIKSRLTAIGMNVYRGGHHDD